MACAMHPLHRVRVCAVVLRTGCVWARRWLQRRGGDVGCEVRCTLYMWSVRASENETAAYFLRGRVLDTGTDSPTRCSFSWAVAILRHAVAAGRSNMSARSRMLVPLK